MYPRFLYKGEKSCFSVKRSSEWVEWGRGTKSWAMTNTDGERWAWGREGMCK